MAKIAAYERARLAGSSAGTPAHQQLRLAIIAAEREALISMRDRSEISDPVMRRLLREFDHDEVLLHPAIR